MRSVHRENGASGLEYAALILLGAMLVFSVAVVDPEPDVEEQVRRALCQMLPRETCEDVGVPGLRPSRIPRWSTA